MRRINVNPGQEGPNKRHKPNNGNLGKREVEQAQRDGSYYFKEFPKEIIRHIFSYCGHFVRTVCQVDKDWNTQANIYLNVCFKAEWSLGNIANKFRGFTFILENIDFDNLLAHFLYIAKMRNQDDDVNLKPCVKTFLFYVNLLISEIIERYERGIEYDEDECELVGEQGTLAKLLANATNKNGRGFFLSKLLERHPYSGDYSLLSSDVIEFMEGNRLKDDLKFDKFYNCDINLTKIIDLWRQDGRTNQERNEDSLIECHFGIPIYEDMNDLLSGSNLHNIGIVENYKDNREIRLVVKEEDGDEAIFLIGKFMERAMLWGKELKDSDCNTVHDLLFFDEKFLVRNKDNEGFADIIFNITFYLRNVILYVNPKLAFSIFAKLSSVGLIEDNLAIELKNEISIRRKSFVNSNHDSWCDDLNYNNFHEWFDIVDLLQKLITKNGVKVEDNASMLSDVVVASFGNVEILNFEDEHIDELSKGLVCSSLAPFFKNKILTILGKDNGSLQTVVKYDKKFLGFFCLLKELIASEKVKFEEKEVSLLNGIIISMFKNKYEDFIHPVTITLFRELLNKELIEINETDGESLKSCLLHFSNRDNYQVFPFIAELRDLRIINLSSIEEKQMKKFLEELTFYYLIIYSPTNCFDYYFESLLKFISGNELLALRNQLSSYVLSIFGILLTQLPAPSNSQTLAAFLKRVEKIYCSELPSSRS